MIEHDIDATEAALVAAMLASDKVPDKNQSGNCFSCDAPMKGLYCSECGQKNDNFRRSIFALIIEAIGTVLSLDSRIWRSWGALLFKPGKVPRAYADGKRSHWSSPVRVYLAMSIILFGFMGWTNTHLVSIDVDPQIKEGVDKPYEDLVKEDIKTKWQVHFFETQNSIDTRNATRDLHLLEIWLSETKINLTPEQRANLNAELDNSLKEIGKAGDAFGRDKVAPVLEAIQKEVQTANDEKLNPLDTSVTPGSNDGLNILVGGQRLTNESGTKLMVNFVKNPIVITRSFNKWLPRLMFLMMPFTMLLGAFFIRDKKKALLFDHLVHAAYIHGFAFFLMFAGIIASRFVTGSTLFLAIFVILLVYLPLSLKRMFGRGWFKTLLTSYGVGLMYLLIIVFALVGAISIDVAKDLELSTLSGA